LLTRSSRSVHTGSTHCSASCACPTPQQWSPNVSKSASDRVMEGTPLAVTIMDAVPVTGGVPGPDWGVTMMRLLYPYTFPLLGQIQPHDHTGLQPFLHRTTQPSQ